MYGRWRACLCRCVLDEAHLIRNERTQSAKSVVEIKAERKCVRFPPYIPLPLLICGDCICLAQGAVRQCAHGTPSIVRF